MAEPLKIITWDHPTLMKVAEPVAAHEFGPALEELGARMLAAMKERDGIGLAAPQVDVSKRIFVMTFPDQPTMSPIIVVNPVLKLSGAILYETEGCLSFPGIHEQVARSAKVDMEYQRPDGTVQVAFMDLWNARVAQHEFDHLDGIMFFDRLTRQMRKKLMKEWDKR